jgi:hypothetical protein
MCITAARSKYVFSCGSVVNKKVKHLVMDFTPKITGYVFLELEGGSII